ncbi:MAG TPA: hypothetical protein VGM83_07340 [Devosiaceae bacterium]
MQKLLLTTCLLVATVLPTIVLAAAEPVPCENSYKDVKTAMGKATLSDIDKPKVNDLVGKGLDHCKADDDAGADDLFAQAMKLIGK